MLERNFLIREMSVKKVITTATATATATIIIDDIVSKYQNLICIY